MKLITAATSNIAYKQKNKLNNAEVLLGDYLELPAFMLKKAQMIALPHPQSASYTHEMLTLCLDKNIDSIYAATSEEAALLLKARQLFIEYNIEIVDVTNEI
ncbi:hypothetical protein [Mucilaginibacter segetis]|uniref:Uncharacterized protein n=1 Tax=Mucilaginibacter segetis TaxID=2793071 RepID=A0A934PQV2_9SPHI|nr:hypothetical protein [Mucilaginibacter segetis]MBK0379084.1 hypothetical protein [Mucilaginibacter segetis]